MLNLEQREGFVNRHTNGLPEHECVIKIVTKDVDGEHNYLCKWKPFDKTQYPENDLPDKELLGTAKVIDGAYKGIGFKAWKQINNEFIWYAIV